MVHKNTKGQTICLLQQFGPIWQILHFLGKDAREERMHKKKPKAYYEKPLEFPGKARSNLSLFVRRKRHKVTQIQTNEKRYVRYAFPEAKLLKNLKWKLQKYSVKMQRRSPVNIQQFLQNCNHEGVTGPGHGGSGWDLTGGPRPYPNLSPKQPGIAPAGKTAGADPDSTIEVAAMQQGVRENNSLCTSIG